MLNHLKFFLPNGLHLDEKRERRVEKKGMGTERGKEGEKKRGREREGEGERRGAERESTL